MKIVFLDIDGVLINRDSLRQASGSNAQADPRCVAALNYITDITGAAIVVSSTHRLLCGDAPNAAMREKLLGWGVTGKVLGCTPDLSRESLKCRGVYEGAERGDEIQAWLERARGPVESFVILDDDSDMKHLSDRLIKTDTERGLTDGDAYKATIYLLASMSEGDSQNVAPPAPRNA